jgi:hypothetical protein
MAGFPAIHVLSPWSVKDVDARDKPGHDGSGSQQQGRRENESPHRNQVRDQNDAKLSFQPPPLSFDCCLWVGWRGW